MYKTVFVSIILGLGVASMSNAGLLEIVTSGIDPAGIDWDATYQLPLQPNTHDVPETQGAIGWYNANLQTTENVILTYEYIGFEAGWTNAFYVEDSLAFLNKDYAGNTASVKGDNVESFAASNTLLDFAFEILEGGNEGYGVENGSNVAPYGVPNAPVNDYSAPNFFLGYADAGHNSVFIALDDGGGQKWNENDFADDNHDDLVLKVTATIAPVPEPATMFLIGTGIAGLVGTRLRRKKK